MILSPIDCKKFFKTNEKLCQSLARNHLAAPHPLRPKMFSISRILLENLAKLYDGALPYGESWIRPCQYMSEKFQFVLRTELDQFSWIKGLFLLLFQRESVQVGYSLWTE